MSEYEFLTTWRIDAPLSRVWDAVEDADAWPEWWKGVLRVVKLKDGDVNGVGSIRRTTWKSALPYTLEFDSEVVRVEHKRCIEARAFGELDGIGVWTFTAESDSRTRVEYDWQVKTTKAWMNILAPVAKPFFRWNHDAIMKWGEQGLKRRLSESSSV